MPGVLSEEASPIQQEQHTIYHRLVKEVDREGVQAKRMQQRPGPSSGRQGGRKKFMEEITCKEQEKPRKKREIVRGKEIRRREAEKSRDKAAVKALRQGGRPPRLKAQEAAVHISQDRKSVV